MLLSDFYTVMSHTGPETEINSAGVSISHSNYHIELNTNHSIYQGHFPGNPVVPGVCQIQMILEMISLIEDKPVRMEKADTVKFLSLIVPGLNPLLCVDIASRESDNGRISANVTISAGETIFLKFKGIFSRS